MRIFIGLIIAFTISMLVYAIVYYAAMWGSLEGDIVFEFSEGPSELLEDTLYVFVVSSQIGPFLDSLDVYYEKNVALLDESIDLLKIEVETLVKIAREEELIFDASFRGIDPSNRLYIENKDYLDKVIGEKDRAEDLYREKRLQLIDEQSGYNGVIYELLKNKIVLKTIVDENGHFSFPKLENDDYYIYSLRILSGNKDITRVPSEMIHIYALSGDIIRKYSWMVRITVDEDTYIRLDSSNISQVFK